MMPYSNFFSNLFGFSWFGWPGFFSLVVILWSIFWKGWALWDAARNEKKGWFVALLVINTVGILEIAYLFFISSNSYSNKERIKHLFSK